MYKAPFPQVVKCSENEKKKQQLKMRMNQNQKGNHDQAETAELRQRKSTKSRLLYDENVQAKPGESLTRFQHSTVYPEFVKVLCHYCY